MKKYILLVICILIALSGQIQAQNTINQSISAYLVRWDDLRVPLNTGRPGASAPTFAQIADDGAASTGVFAFLFADGPADEEIHFSGQMPHSWMQGDSIEAHIHAVPQTNNTGTLVIGLEYLWVNIDGTITNTTIIADSMEVTGQLDEHFLMELGWIQATDMTISSMLVCRLFRDVSLDDLTGDVAILEFDFHYRLDSNGSTQEAIKD